MVVDCTADSDKLSTLRTQVLECKPEEAEMTLATLLAVRELIARLVYGYLYITYRPEHELVTMVYFGRAAE